MFKFMHNLKFFFSCFLLLALVQVASEAQVILPLQPNQPVPVYRGKRSGTAETTATEEEQTETLNTKSQRRFLVEKISVEQTAPHFVIIVSFNIPVNPLSISQESVFINTQHLSNSASIKFNRTGTELHLLIPIEEIYALAYDENQDLHIIINKISAYENNKTEEQQQIDKLEFAVSCSYGD